MAKRGVSPTLTLNITDEQYDQAKQAASGGCLIADAIKRQYPHLSGVSVDMATIRVTDKTKGERYIYLTPEPAQRLLLSFDQGWRLPDDRVTIRRAVQILPIKSMGRATVAKRQATRETKHAELEAKIAAGATLTPSEKRSHTQLTKNLEQVSPAPKPARPESYGPVEILEDNPRGPAVIRGGKPPTNDPNPNLLRGRNRHFGAKLAKPGQQWEEAVEKAVAEALAAQ